MALVFRCDGCERLEGHDPRNKWQSEKAGSVCLTKSNDNDRSPNISKDLCKECVDKVDKFLRGLVNTTTA